MKSKIEFGSAKSGWSIVRGFSPIVLLLIAAISSQAVPPPSGVAPVLLPHGGFGIEGDLVENGLTGVGDWVGSPKQPGSGVLREDGTPIDPAHTFHFVDPYNKDSDLTFGGGLKWTDDPSTWRWTMGKAPAKADVNNVLMHLAEGVDGHTWLILAADRLDSSGDSYIDFEFLQRPLIRNANGGFDTAGTDGGRTVNDLVLSLAFVNGGTAGDFYAWRWQPLAGGGFGYVDATPFLPEGRVFLVANTNSMAVPFGAFGQTTYLPNCFVEAAIDLTALISNFDPCLSLGVKTVMVKTKISQSDSSSMNDFIDPIQLDVNLGPSADAGPDQVVCTDGTPVEFSLHGQTTPGLFPAYTTNWSVIAGTAKIVSADSLDTKVVVASSSATLRLTIQQRNGCMETDDVVLSAVPRPAVSITGAEAVCPFSSAEFSAPSGFDSYAWTVSGDGEIVGPSDARTVTVAAGGCGGAFSLVLNAVSNVCSTSALLEVQVNDTEPPMLTCPADLTLEYPAETGTNFTGIATATDGCGPVSLDYQDAVTVLAGGNRIIARTWIATDVCGNPATAVQTIKVLDTIAPTITLPGDVTIEAPGDVNPTVTGTAGGQDPSGVVMSYSDQVSTICGSARVILRTWTATDAAGNISHGTQTITVLDTTAPTVIAPANITLEAPADTRTSITGVATAQDAGGSVTVSYVDSSSLAGSVISRTWTATDDCGNTASAVQIITVHTTPPTITSGPQSQTVPEGGSTTLTVVASGTDLDYQWQHDGTNIAGATTSSLPLTNVQSGDAGNYTVIVSNPGGSTPSEPAVITVTTSTLPPSILSGPRSQNVELGTDVTMSVVATNGTLTYQWRYYGIEIPGATTSSLTLSSVQFTNAGIYDVVVANTYGSVTASAILNVLPTLGYVRDGDEMTLTWPGPFVLQEAPECTGPFTDIMSATSPYVVNVRLAPRKFFRLRPIDFDLKVTYLQNGDASLAVTGVPGLTFIIQASSDLSNWVNISTNTAPATYVDTAGAGAGVRFYRAIPAWSAISFTSPSVTQAPSPASVARQSTAVAPRIEF